MADVKTPRAYDASRRRARAEASRAAVRDTAWRLFAADGYTATTVGAIAAAADVSAETIYKSFGGKAGLLRAIADAALAGPDAVPTMRQSDELGARESDPYAIVEQWAAFACEVAPRFAPVVLLIASASGTSDELADLLDQLDAFRLDRMAHQARFLAGRGYLRPDITLDDARDVMWAYTDPSMYDLLVQRRRWPIQRYRDFLADALIVALLPPRHRPRGHP